MSFVIPKNQSGLPDSVATAAVSILGPSSCFVTGVGSDPQVTPYLACATSVHNSASSRGSDFRFNLLTLLLRFFNVTLGMLMVSQLSQERIVVLGKMAGE